MIERLARAIKWFQAAVVGGIALASESMLTFLRQRLHDSFVSGVIVLAVAVLAFKAAEKCAEWALDESLWLRKLILGAHFIEGYWIDKVEAVESARTLDSYAIVKIRCHNARYEVTGESFGTDGKPLGTFRCYTSQYSEYQLRYAYDGINIRHPDSKVEGYGEYYFTPGVRCPVSFSGFIYDTYHARRVNLQAEKITNSTMLATIDTLETRKAIIAAFGTDELRKK